MDLGVVLRSVGFDLRIFLFNLINFLIIMLLLKKFFFGKIAYILQERRRFIDETQEKAEKLSNELENLEKKKKKVLTDAELQKNKLIQDAHSQALREAKKTHEKALDEAKFILKEGRKSALKEREAILEEVKREVARIVTDELKTKITN